MSIQFKCDVCLSILEVSDASVGELVRCPACIKIIRVAAQPAQVSKDATEPKHLPPPLPQDDDRPSKLSRTRDDEVDEDDRRHARDDDDDGPSRRRRFRDDEVDDDDGRDARDADDKETDDDRPARRPKLKKRKRKKKRRSSSSQKTIKILGVAVAALLGVAFLVMLPRFKPDVVMGTFHGGQLLALAGSIWILILAFKDEVTTGFLCLCIPFYQLYFIVSNFDDAKWPFLLELAGWIVMVVAIISMTPGQRDLFIKGK